VDTNNDVFFFAQKIFFERKDAKELGRKEIYKLYIRTLRLLNLANSWRSKILKE
jgi:hypothetical protein